MDTLPALNSPSTRTSGIRWQIYLAGLLTLVFLIYFFQPGLAAWWLQRNLTEKAEGNNLTVKISKLEADFITGHILLAGVQLNDPFQSANQIDLEEIQVEFSLWRFLFKKELSPVTKIAIGKSKIVWKWQPGKSEKRTKSVSQVLRNCFPETFTGNGISANLECGNAKIDIANADFTFFPNAAGEIDIPRLTASLLPWKRTFNNLEGVTSIKERALYVGGIKFFPDLVLERGTLDFTKPEKQKITSDLLFSAFGGQWRTDIDLERRKTPIEIDAAASFWNLSVKQLGEFVGNHELAEGLIHEGRITFQGNPAEPARSNTTLRLNATDFRWHERQWNSLIASAILVNRRIDIPQFDLVQNKNQIQLKGHAELPAKWTQLPGEFQLQVLAQIDDLHSAALLLLPGQKGIEGEAFFAGEVRKQNGQFSGNLKMRGGPLQISGVAVDRVRGDLYLQGSEVKATALELARRDDKATGWAMLNLAEPRRYSGEFQILAGDIADYTAILPRAVADRAAAGGVRLWWSGDGSSQAHSGAFKVNLQDFLVSHGKNTVPLDVESHGSYSPAGITLNHLVLQRPNTKLITSIVVRPESMELRDLRVTGSGGSRIQGDITLPINLLAALDNPTLASLLESRAAATGQISGNNVRLDELCELAGSHWPIRGRANFNLNAKGPLESLEAGLQIGLNDFFAPNDLSIPSLVTKLQLNANQLTLHSEINPTEARDSLSLNFSWKTNLSQTTLSKGQWLNLEAPLSGKIEAKRLATSLLHPWWKVARAFKGDIGGNLSISGTAQAPVFEGQIALQNTEWQPTWLSYPLQKLNGLLTIGPSYLTTEKITGSYRGGSFTVGGTSGFHPAEALDLTIEGKSLTLLASDASEAVVDGTVQLYGKAPDRVLGGLVQIQSAVLYRELTISTPPVALPVISRFSLPWIAPEWKINLEVTAAHPIEIRGKSNTWTASPELIFRDMAHTPIIKGQLSIRPMALTKNTNDDSMETRVYFQDSILENGTVENAKSILTSELAPSPSLDPTSSTATPQPTPEIVPRRLEIIPVQ